MLLAGFTLMLSMEGPAGCPLDHANVYAIPPSTFQVLTTSQCGAILCWERYVVTNGKRIDLGRACEVPDNDGRRRIQTVPPAGHP